METVLEKTIASLERALQDNPDNVELLASLLEHRVRAGLMDERTRALCERVVETQPENQLSLQAQGAILIIEQTDQIDETLGRAHDPPSQEALQASIEVLDDFLAEWGDASDDVVFTWVRLCALSGLLERVSSGVRRLRERGYPRLKGLRVALDWMALKLPPERLDWLTAYEVYALIEEPAAGLLALERAYDKGVAREETGPILLHHYLSRFDLERPSGVPETTRLRFLQTLLDHGDATVAREWLARASTFGWDVSSHARAFGKRLLDQGELSSAFAVLRLAPLDAQTREHLNAVASRYEEQDRIDEAVEVLRYINDHILSDDDLTRSKEADLAREMELTMAEFHMKNDRPDQALTTYVSALCLRPDPDPAIMERIDEILGGPVKFDAAALIRLATYFRARGDHSKTVLYVNRVLDREPDNAEALHFLKSLFEEILQAQPGNPDLRLELGRLHQRLGHPTKAIEEYKLAADSPAHQEEAHRHLAYAYAASGLPLAALGEFQELTLEEPDFDALYQLHFALARDGDLRAALTALDLIRGQKPAWRDIDKRIEKIERRLAGTGPHPAAALPAADEKMRELIGDHAVGRYRYVEQVGSGGMGVVHKVEEIKTHRLLAMKILRDGLASSSRALDRFFREARIAATIRHRNIVEIVDYNISAKTGQSFICMEFVDGPTLREIIDRKFDQGVEISSEYLTETLYYTVQLLDALEATHSQGIVHRDIKPDNIMVTSDGLVKITDFGIVHVEDAAFTQTGAMLGTPRYMAPEQITGGRIDGRSDIYSAGILLYESLTGSPPFITGDIAYQHVNKRPALPQEINPAIPDAVNDFIMKCLEKDPERRYASAREAKTILAQILKSLGGCPKYESSTMRDSGGVDRLDPGTHEPTPAAELDSDLDLQGHLGLEEIDEPPSAGPLSAPPAAEGRAPLRAKDPTESGEVDPDLDVEPH